MQEKEYRSPAEKNFGDYLCEKGIFFLANVRPDPLLPVVDFLIGGKLIVEIDGKGFHNKKEDAKRDAVMRKAGFDVFRIPASNTFDRDKLKICWREIEKKSRMTDRKI
ncbi:MAG: endonuclease domain-containing protein [Nanoarchaeota archaeon]|nr:endonuclease domain-containing protein [Nanoarchaeota archaeon]